MEIDTYQQLTSKHFSQLSDVPTYAITLSLSAIRTVRHNLCCAFGTHKAKILKTALTALPSEACPATILRLDGDSHNSLLTDTSACQFYKH